MVKQKIVKNVPSAVPTVSKPLWEHKQFLSGLVFLFSFLLFANSIFNGYNLDDELVTRDHHLTAKGIAAIPEIFTSAYYQDNMGYAYEYRPVVLASFAIEHQFFGDSAPVSHFFNVLLYAFTCLLLLKVLLKLFRNYSPLLSFAITLLFIAHTSHTEVVCSIKNRDEILGLGFSLLALHYTLRAVRSGKILAYLLIPVFYSLALMSKTTVIAFGIIIPMAIIFFEQVSFRRVLLISSLLLVPAYLFINLSSGFDKLKMVIALLVVVILCFLLKNLNTIFHQVKDRIDRGLSVIGEKGNKEGSVEEPKVTWTNAKDFFAGVYPDRKVFKISYLLITLTLGLLYSLAVYHSFSLAAVLPLLVLLALAWFGNRNLSWSATTVLFICLALNKMYFTSYLQIDETPFLYKRLLTSAFVFIIFWGRRDLFFTCLFSYIFIISFDGTKHLGEFLATVPLTYLVRYYWFRIICFIGLPILMANDLYFQHTLPDWDKVVALVLMISVHFQKRIMEAYWLVIVAAIVLFHIAQFGYDNNVIRSSGQFVNRSINAVSKTTDQLNPQIIKTQYRPIQYVENCVSMSDKITIRIGTSSEILLRYLEKTIVPYPLSFYYGYSFIKPEKITDGMPLLGFVLYLLIFILAVIFSFRDPLIGFGLFLYLFSIGFFSNFFAYVPGMMGDRYLLVPSLGWCIVLAGILYKSSNQKDGSNTIQWSKIGPPAKYIFSVVLVFYSVLTFSRNMDWKDDLTLFRKDIRYVNESSQAHNLLALHLMQHSEIETVPDKKTELAQEALGHFKKAKEIYPAFFNVTFDIGRVYLKLNMPDSALMSLKEALTLDTVYPEIYRMIGDIYNYKQMYGAAEPYYEKLIRLEPANYEGYSKLSYDYFMQKNYDSSISVNKKALISMPNQLQPIINIARVFIAINKPDSASVYLNTALKLQPNNGDVLGLLKQINK